MPASTSVAVARPRLGVRQVVRDYAELCKFKVQSLLLLTTVTTMYVAGTPSVELVLLTLLGGSLSAGGAGAVNHWYDRDIDLQMTRTANRPVAASSATDGSPATYIVVIVVRSSSSCTFGLVSVK